MPKQIKQSETKPQPPPAAQRPPTHEEIEGRAYAIYLNRGRTDGCDLEDWLQAERELMQES